MVIADRLAGCDVVAGSSYWSTLGMPLPSRDWFSQYYPLDKKV